MRVTTPWMNMTDRRRDGRHSGLHVRESVLHRDTQMTSKDILPIIIKFVYPNQRWVLYFSILTSSFVFCMEACVPRVTDGWT